jgi:hypothetical protein
VPTSGPVGIPFTLDFTNVTTVSTDFALEQMQGAIEFIQAIYIDNSENATPVEIVFSGMLYEIQCKGSRQGIWPVLAPTGALSLTAGATQGTKVPCIVFNVQQPYFIWDV